MVQHQQLSDTLMADAVLAGQDERVGEELLTDRADELPLDVFDRDLVMETRRRLRSSTLKLALLHLGFCMRHNTTDVIL